MASCAEGPAKAVSLTVQFLCQIEGSFKACRTRNLSDWVGARTGGDMDSGKWSGAVFLDIPVFFFTWAKYILKM